MCGRFVRAKASETYDDFYGIVEVPYLPSYNIAPTQPVVVIRMEEAAKKCVVMRWGLIPSWAKDKKTSFINARADTIADKPAFRAAFKRRRCLILADGYFEWKTRGPKQKQPYYLRPKDDGPIAFAGIWETWKGAETPIESCSIITTDANELSRMIHDRMPVMLREPEADAWIDSAVEEPRGLLELLRPFPAELMCCDAVGQAVNSVKNNDPSCIEVVV
jgi:putative SOS response-associated peptidase YedK